jgi:hypothetical protein
MKVGDLVKPHSSDIKGLASLGVVVLVSPDLPAIEVYIDDEIWAFLPEQLEIISEVKKAKKD